MKFIKNTDSIEHKNSDECIAFEYPLNDKDINVAFVEINGRYPDSGKMFNEECKEIAFVVEGDGKVVVNDEEFVLEKGDLILIEPKEHFYWEGKLKVLLSCSPAWTLEQYKKAL
jgi:mannose-6-phosphate isomerase-like protein (cupin superfamily)